MTRYPLDFVVKGSGFTINERAGEALGDRKLVYRAADAFWYLADADAAGTMPVLGITMGAIPSGNKGEILRLGYIGLSTWTWTTGGEIYASTTAGELTQTAPAGVGDIVQIVGMATDTNMLYFNSDLGNRGGAAAGGEGRFAPDFIVDSVGTDVVVYDGDNGSLVRVEVNWSLAMQWAVDNLSVRGGWIHNRQMEETAPASVLIEDRNSIRITGAAPATVTDGTHFGMGATQINSTIVGDAVFKIVDSESITIENFYLFTSRTDNYGILIDGTNVVVEHHAIIGCNIRRFLRGIYFHNVWASNVGGLVERCHITAANAALAVCIYGEDINHWSFRDCVFSGNGQNANCVFITEGDAARTVRVSWINCQFIAAKEWHLRVNVPSANGRFTGIAIVECNFETLSAGDGIASIWFEGIKSRAVVGMLGCIMQSLNGHEAIQIDNVEGEVYIETVGCDGVTPVLNNNGTSGHINIRPGFNVDRSENEGIMLASTNPSGDTPVTESTEYFPLWGLTGGTTEARAQIPIRRDGTVKSLRIHADAGANDAVATFRDDAADTALTVTITGGGGEAVYADNTNQDTVSLDSLIDVKIVSGVDPPTIYSISVEYTW